MDNTQLRTLQKKRTTNFREDETKLLIQLWGSPVIQNKLYLTHRKAPVMRLLAANMQSRGFYRTPDEIKTRIRNLKCLYHRIKRTMACGTGLGTVDPDWPHFKAMDAILSKEGIRKPEIPTNSHHSDDSMLEGPKCEDIKQEVDDLDINDDMNSWAGNESNGSEYEEETILPILSPCPNNKKETPIKPKMPTLVPSFTLPTVAQAQSSQNIVRTHGASGMSSIPLPLLILNSLQPQHNSNHDGNNKSSAMSSSNADAKTFNDKYMNSLIKDLVDVQRQTLEVEKQKLEVEKQRLEFDRVVGSQLMTLVPMIGGVLQRLVFPQPVQEQLNNCEAEQERHNVRKRTCEEDSDYDILKDSKILRTVLERGIKKYMMEDNSNDNKDLDAESDKSDNEDSGIQNDEEEDTNENSNCSEK